MWLVPQGGGVCGWDALLLVGGDVFLHLAVSLPQTPAWCPGSLKLLAFLALASPLRDWGASPSLMQWHPSLATH